MYDKDSLGRDGYGSYDHRRSYTSNEVHDSHSTHGSIVKDESSPVRVREKKECDYERSSIDRRSVSKINLQQDHLPSHEKANIATQVFNQVPCEPVDSTYNRRSDIRSYKKSYNEYKKPPSSKEEYDLQSTLSLNRTRVNVIKENIESKKLLYSRYLRIRNDFFSLLNFRESKDSFIKHTEIDNIEQKKYFDFFDKLSSKLFLANKYLSERNIDTCHIVVCGKQSSGKSSLVASWTGIKTVISDGTSTRQPIVYQSYNSEVFQAKVWSEGNKNGVICNNIQELNRYMLETQSNIKGNISPETLYVRILSPSCQRLTLVDLPGDILDDDKQDADARERMYVEYVKPSNLILRVIPAGIDYQTDERFQKMLKEQMESSVIVINTKTKSGAEDEVTKYKSKDNKHHANGIFNNGIYIPKNDFKIAVFGVDIPITTVDDICNNDKTGNIIKDKWNRLDKIVYDQIKGIFTSAIDSKELISETIGHEGAFGLQTSFNAVAWLSFQRNKAMYEIIKNIEVPNAIYEIEVKIDKCEVSKIEEDSSIAKFFTTLNDIEFFNSVLTDEYYIDHRKHAKIYCKTFTGPVTSAMSKSLDLPNELLGYTEHPDGKGHSPTYKEIENPNSASGGNDNYHELEAIDKKSRNFLKISLRAIVESSSAVRSDPLSIDKIHVNDGLALTNLSKIIWGELYRGFLESTLDFSNILFAHICNKIDRELKCTFFFGKDQKTKVLEKTYEMIKSIVQRKYESISLSYPNLNGEEPDKKIISAYALFFYSLQIESNHNDSFSVDLIKSRLFAHKHKLILGAKLAAATTIIGGGVGGTIAAISPLLPFLGISLGVASIFAPSLASATISAGSTVVKKSLKVVKLAVTHGKKAAKKDKIEKDKYLDFDFNSIFSKDMETNLDYPRFFATAESQINSVQRQFYNKLVDTVYKESIHESLTGLIGIISATKTQEVLNPEVNKKSKLYQYRELTNTRNELKDLLIL